MRYDSGSRWETRPQIVARLAAGEVVLSLGVRNARTGDIARVASSSGYGVVWIDLEHSSMGIDVAAQIAATAHDLGIVAWVGDVGEARYDHVGGTVAFGAKLVDDELRADTTPAGQSGPSDATKLGRSTAMSAILRLEMPSASAPAALATAICGRSVEAPSCRWNAIRCRPDRAPRR